MGTGIQVDLLKERILFLFQAKNSLTNCFFIGIGTKKKKNPVDKNKNYKQQQN